MDNITYLAYVRYQGKLVNEGLLDARKSAEALYGTDEIIRYFLELSFPKLKSVDYEIPVKIQKGSWEILIPDNVQMLQVLTIWMLGKYAGSALSEMAKNDFQNVSTSDIIKKIFESIVSVIKIAIHLKSMKKKRIEKLDFIDGNEKIGIKNELGETLYFSKEDIELYAKCPDYLFDKVGQLVEEERELEIGIINEEVKIQITNKDKNVFVKEKNELILPELSHGDYVELKGHVTRGNERTNALGFLYKDHILHCMPYDGNVVDYKGEMFSYCNLKGVIDRKDKFGNVVEKKPKIFFTELTLVDSKKKESPKLF